MSITLPQGDWARTNHLAVVGDVKAKETALKNALDGKGEWPFSKVLNTSIGDLGKFLPVSGLKVLPKGLEFLKEIPVVDVLAAGLIGHLHTVSDEEKGWSPAKAEVSDYGSQAVGLAAGVGVVAAAALAPVEAPVALVVGAAGLVVWSVADLGVSITHEHWAEDIHDRGVVSGLVHGTGHVFSQTGSALKHDLVDVGSAIGDGAKSVWHSVFG